MMTKMKAKIQVVAMALLVLWLGGSAVRAMIQRVDAIVVCGFGLGAWAAWVLLRMAWAELREVSDHTEG